MKFHKTSISAIMTDNEDPKYLLGDSNQELERLRMQHVWVQSCLKGQIVFAPIDLHRDGLKVLDVGCADGKSSVHVQNGT